MGGFLIEQLGRGPRAEADELYFWRTDHGVELDLLLVRGRRRDGFEIKRSAAPTMTPSMRDALEDLRLDHLHVIHRGTHRFAIHDRVEAVPWTKVLALARTLW